jgi:anti-sigma28 factor (negative regulator of flagellin synthesis)
VADDNRSLATLAGSLRRLTPGTPEREAFLARLAEEIRSGKYQVDEEGLAESLLDQLRPDSKVER